MRKLMLCLALSVVWTISSSKTRRRKRGQIETVKSNDADKSSELRDEYRDLIDLEQGLAGFAQSSGIGNTDTSKLMASLAELNNLLGGAQDGISGVSKSPKKRRNTREGRSGKNGAGEKKITSLFNFSTDAAALEAAAATNEPLPVSASLAVGFSKAAFQDVARESGFMRPDNNGHSKGFEFHRPVNPPNCIFNEAKPSSAGASKFVSSFLTDSGALCMVERNLGGAAAADINNDSWPDLFLGSIGSAPSLLMNRGRDHRGWGGFSEEAARRGLHWPKSHKGWASGGSFFDCDNDGDEDLIVTTVGGDRNLLFLNNGSGFFEEVAAARGLEVVSTVGDDSRTAATTVAIGDFDNDGGLDLLFGEWMPHVVRNSSIGFDIKVTGLGTESIQKRKGAKLPLGQTGVRLMRNLVGMGRPCHFQDVSMDTGIAEAVQTAELRRASASQEGVYVFAPAFVDLDGDGWLDLAVTGDFGTSMLLWNERGRFVDGTTTAGVHTVENAMGSAIHDFDGDGRLDWFVSSIYHDSPTEPNTAFGHSGNRLYRNLGNRQFEDSTDSFGVRDAAWGWGAALLDHDNSGLPGLFVTNGYYFAETTADDKWNWTPNRFFIPANRSFHDHDACLARVTGQQRKRAPWKEEAAVFGLSSRRQGRGVLTLDMDQDGDQDSLVINHIGNHHLYENLHIGPESWLRVRVFERRGGRHSLGAEVSVIVSGFGSCTEDVESSADGKRLVRLVGGAHFMGQHENAVHFGLGVLPPRAVVVVHVRFPASGIRVVKVEGVQPNRSISIFRVEGNWVYDSDPQQAAADVLMTKDGLPVVDERDHTGNVLESAAASGVEQKVDVSSSPHGLRRATLWVAKLSDAEIRRVARPPHGGRPEAAGAGSELIRKAEAAYGDGRCSPAGQGRPSARVVSQELMSAIDEHAAPSKRNLSDLHMHFGQLLAHDVDHTTPQANMLQEEWFPIQVPRGDPDFENVIRFRRSIFNNRTGCAPGAGVRQQLTKVTGFVDVSVLYGSDARRLNALRQGAPNGEMRTSNQDARLPPSSAELGVQLAADNPTQHEDGTEDLFATGDNRANVQPGLLALHALLMQEHNFLVRELRAAGVDPNSSTLFERARMLLEAEFQIISYSEYLPALLGRSYRALFGPYRGYNASVSPGVSNEFSTVAFRFGHSQVNDFLPMFNDRLDLSIVALRDWYFKPRKFLKQFAGANALSKLLTGSVFIQAREVDVFAQHGVRNRLFGRREEGGSDLFALNIQRGRDHGIPNYNRLREAYGLPAYTNCTELTKAQKICSKLESLYGPEPLKDLDPYVGMLAEQHIPESSAGALLEAMLLEQFGRLRDGDPFWYENILPSEISRDMEDATSLEVLLSRHVPRELSRLLRGNPMSRVQSDTSSIFFAKSLNSQAVLGTTSSPRAASGTDTNFMPDLLKLVELHQAGLLSKEEFGAAKKKLLNL